MTAPHRAPDGGVCQLIGHGQHGVIRVYGSVSWEAVGQDTCPTPSTTGVYECYACDAAKVAGTAYDAAGHSETCSHAQSASANTCA